MQDSSAKAETEKSVPAAGTVSAEISLKNSAGTSSAGTAFEKSVEAAKAAKSAENPAGTPAAEAPRRPFVALLDMRTKIFVSLAATVGSIALNDWRLLLAVNFITLIYVLSLRRFVPVIAMYAITILMLGIAYFLIPLFAGIFEFIAQFLPENFGQGFSELGKSLDSQGFATVRLPFMRIAVSMNVFLAFGLTFDNQEFVAVMRKLHLPRIIFIPLMVCCRFIPSFTDDIRRLYEGLKIRRRKMNVLTLMFRPGQVLRFIVVPVCVRTLNIADNLVMMCEVRRIGSNRRCICAREQRFHLRDAAVILLVVLCIVGIVALKQALPPPEATFTH